MLNRIVKQIHPVDKDASEPVRKPFAEVIEEFPNVILLGDPGTGKTHLFQNAAEYENGLFKESSDYIRLRTLIPKDQILYVDGLDEHRASHKNIDAMTALIEAMVENRPSHFRLSCRSTEWLGSTDLTALEAYFDVAGGQDYAVVELEALTDEEIDSVLTALNVEDTETFRSNAVSRGVGFLLERPQTLQMLVETVKQGAWPSTKAELFENATSIMVGEHNTQHLDHSEKSFTEQELVDCAGHVCSALLIAGKKEIIVSSRRSDDIPHYQDITISDKDLLQTVLKSKAFLITDSDVRTVRFQHRTLAEYLGAKWLHRMIVDGKLTLQKCICLLCVDGFPVSELRGLYAWLTYLLYDERAQLIKYDPYGVLAYADCTSFPAGHRTFLLEALVKLSEKAPWFKGGYETSDLSLRGLSAPDMEASFAQILSSGNHEMIGLVLDAISLGPVIPGLETCLSEFFTDRTKRFPPRFRAGQAIMNKIPGGDKKLSDLTRGLPAVKENIKLKYSIISEYYSQCFSHQDLVKVTKDFLRFPDIGTIYGLWDLHEKIPLGHLDTILDQFAAFDEVDGFQRRRHFEDLFANLLTKALSNIENIPIATLWTWLRSFAKYHDWTYQRDPFKGVQNYLKSNQDLVFDLFTYSFEDWDHGASKSYWFIFKTAVFHTHDDNRIAQYAIDYLDEPSIPAKQREEMFIILMFIIYSMDPINDDLVQRTIALGESDPDLSECYKIRKSAKVHLDQELVEIINDRRRKREENNNQHRRELVEHIDSIRGGDPIGWLGHLGMVYYCQCRDLNKEASPKERIGEFYGNQYVEPIIEGLKRYIKRNDIISTDEVLDLHIKGKYQRIWFAILAGLEESFSENSDLNAYPESLFETALIIRFLFHWRDKIKVPAWETALFETKPDMVTKVCTKAIIRQGAGQHQDTYILGVLCEDERLSDYRKSAARQILYAVPHLEGYAIRRLIEIVIDSLPSEERRELIRHGLSPYTVMRDARSTWYSFAFVFAFELYSDRIIKYAQGNSPALTALFDTLNWALNHETIDVSIEQLVFFVKLLGRQFPRIAFESGMGNDKTGQWENSRVVTKGIDLIAGMTSPQATRALEELLEDDNLKSYTIDFNRALEQHRILCRQKRYDQPTWQDTLSILTGAATDHVPSLWAMTKETLKEVERKVRFGTTDIYKRFWNEDQYSRITTPKVEESCRDVLIDLLRPFYSPHGIRLEPEGHMASDKRADIIIYNGHDQKMPIELKRDIHDDIWTACEDQLKRMYARDPESQGYGLYGVFWLGTNKDRKIATPPKGIAVPKTAQELEESLKTLIKPEDRHRLGVFVLDVTIPFPTKKGAGRLHQKG